jgi:DHA1 family multidrug resistance protein-like MFS transporter
LKGGKAVFLGTNLTERPRDDSARLADERCASGETPAADNGLCPSRRRGIRRFRKSSFLALCVVMTFENVAANMVHPVEPAFYIQLGLPAYTFGVAYAAMALGLFALSPFWGVLSDRVGRMPVLSGCAVVYGLAQLMFVMSKSVLTITIARFIAGSFCAGCLTTGMAYVADVSEPSKVGKHMAAYGALLNLTCSGGFLLGGFVGNGCPERSFIAQFGLLAVTGALAFLLLDEGPNFRPSKEPLTFARANPLAAFASMRGLVTPWMASFLVAALAAHLASAAFSNSFNYYLRDQFGFPSTYNGIIFAATGVLGFAANMTIGMRLQRARRVERPLWIVLLLCAVVLAASLAASDTAVYLAITFVFYVLNSMYLPLMQALVVQGDAGHGALSGIFQSTTSMGSVIGALAAGFIYAPAPRSPFVLAAAFFAVGSAASAIALRIAAREDR